MSDTRRRWGRNSRFRRSCENGLHGCRLATQKVSLWTDRCWHLSLMLPGCAWRTRYGWRNVSASLRLFSESSGAVDIESPVPIVARDHRQLPVTSERVTNLNSNRFGTFKGARYEIVTRRSQNVPHLHKGKNQATTVFFPSLNCLTTQQLRLNRAHDDVQRWLGII